MGVSRLNLEDFAVQCLSLVELPLFKQELIGVVEQCGHLILAQFRLLSLLLGHASITV